MRCEIDINNLNSLLELHVFEEQAKNKYQEDYENVLMKLLGKFRYIKGGRLFNNTKIQLTITIWMQLGYQCRMK